MEMPKGIAKDGINGLLFRTLIFSMAKVLGGGGHRGKTFGFYLLAVLYLDCVMLSN